MRVRMVHGDSGGVRLADKTLLFMMLFDAKNAACYKLAAVFSWSFRTAAAAAAAAAP